MTKICKRCATVYKGSGYKAHCTKGCFHKTEYANHFNLSPGPKKEIYNHNCQQCGREFQNNRKVSKYCDFACSHKSKLVSPEEKIRRANEKWLKGEKLKPKTPKSYGQLNREAEWKRVWDDQSWTSHYGAVRG